MLSSDLVRSFGYVMPYIVCIWAISFKFFLGASEVLDVAKVTPKDGQTDLDALLEKKVISDSAKEFSNIAILIFLMYWLIPLRVMFSCVFDDDKFNKISETYEQVCLKFPVHYDVENPIT
jgi:hypothetical protein